jgi:hypothetical protein
VADGEVTLTRRGLLASVGALLAGAVGPSGAIVGLLGSLGLLGCAAGAQTPVAPAQGEAALPPLKLATLSGLLPLAHLRWAVLAEPREVAAIPWLIPAVARVAPEENLARFATSVGFDLRQVREAIVASYGAGDGPESTLYLVRHNVEPSAVERAFRARLVADERRAVDAPEIIRVSGKVGTSTVTLLLLGRDVAAFQVGGAASRGPARIASLYAQDKLKRSPTILAEDPLKALDARLGRAPVRAFAPGPFEGELARGARGLLAGATAVGATVRPSAREALLVVIAVAGDFAKSGPAASRELSQAWDELARGSFGHLLGLDEPIEPPLATHAADAVALAIEIDPTKLAKGLASATSARIEEIMR